MAHKMADIKTHFKYCLKSFLLILRLHAQMYKSLSCGHVFMCIPMDIHLIAQGSSLYSILVMTVFLFWLIS